MSHVPHGEWDRAYEEGREAGRREAWSGDYDYRTLIAEARTAALRDAVEAVEDRIQDLSTCNKDDDCHMLARGAALALSDIESLGGDR